MSKVPATTRNSGKTSLALPAPRVTVTRTSLSTMTGGTASMMLKHSMKSPSTRSAAQFLRAAKCPSTAVLLKLLSSAYVWCDALRIAIESEISTKPPRTSNPAEA